MKLGKNFACVLTLLLLLLGNQSLAVVQQFDELAVESELAGSAESLVSGADATDELNENFCLSAGLLKRYRCDSNTIESQIAAGQRYSIQLLIEGDSLPKLPEALALFHRTQLSGEKAFIYVGEFTEQQEALDTMTALVMVGTLEPDVWRPAVVQVDKSREVPGVRLIQMYKDKSFSKSTMAAVASDPLTYSGRTSGSGKILPSYYTVQLASFETVASRNEFISGQSYDASFLCRQRRNGRHTVYSGAFNSEKDARRKMRELQKHVGGAYVLRLKQEDMFSCDAKRRLLVVSHPESIASASPLQANFLATYFTAQIASFSTVQERLDFVRDNSQFDFSCRTRRNGKFVAYSGAFADKKELKTHIRGLRRQGLEAYELKLQAEDMFDCENEQRIVLYSKTIPSATLPSDESTKPIVDSSALAIVESAERELSAPSKDFTGKSQPSLPDGSENKYAQQGNGERISGLQSLAKINLGDSSISQALSKGSHPVVKREGVVQLNVIAPEKNKEPRLTAVPVEEASELPAYYQRRPNEGARLSRKLAQARDGQAQDGQVRPFENDDVPMTATASVESEGALDLVVEPIKDEEPLVGRLANDWQPSPAERFYTVQLATFRGPINEGRFVKRHQNLDPLCRVRRNGQLAVYSGKFVDFESARTYLRSLGGKLDGYVVMLQGELLPPCSI